MKLEDLAKIKAQMKDKVSLREGSGNVRVVVGMATCGLLPAQDRSSPLL